MVAQSTRFPISCSSICPSAFCHSDFSPQAAASCLNLNPCSRVAQHKRFLTVVSRTGIRPFTCWPPSQPSYAFHPHHGQLMILRSHVDARHTRSPPTSVPAFVPSLVGSSSHFRTTSFHISACRSQCFSVARHTRFPILVPAFVPLHFGSSTRTTTPRRRLHSRKRSTRDLHSEYHDPTPHP
jgi:hypothetical protein